MEAMELKNKKYCSESWVYNPHFWLFSLELTNSQLLSQIEL